MFTLLSMSVAVLLLLLSLLLLLLLSLLQVIPVIVIIILPGVLKTGLLEILSQSLAHCKQSFKT